MDPVLIRILLVCVILLDNSLILRNIGIINFCYFIIVDGVVNGLCVVYVCMCMCVVYICACVNTQRLEEGIGFSTAGVIRNCEQSHVGSWS